MKCDLCGRVLNSEEVAAGSQLCPDCLEMIMDEKLQSENIVNESGEIKSSKRFVIVWFCVCAILTAVVSYNFSAPILDLFDYIFDYDAGGFFGNSFECLAAALPGLLGFIIAFIALGHKGNPYLCGIKSVGIGIIAGCVVILSVHIWDYCAIRFD
jgi:hypothetical protein